MSGTYVRPVALIFDDRGELAELSNDFLFPLAVDCTVWRSVEHYYQAQKFSDAADRALVNACPSGALARELVWGEMHGRVRSDWDSIRLGVMRRAIQLKFQQSDQARERLLASWPFPIGEDSPIDEFWGLGKSGAGENWLGRLLQDARADLFGCSSDLVRFKLSEELPHANESRVAAANCSSFVVHSLRKPIADAHIPSGSAILCSIEQFVSGDLHDLEFENDSMRSMEADSSILERMLDRAVSSTDEKQIAWRLARAKAFDKKYSSYLWASDARSGIENWVGTFFALLTKQSPVSLDRADAIVVGAGSAEEAAHLWAKFPGNVVLTDIGENLVENCRQQCPHAAQVLRRDAEDLFGVSSGRFDIYCSLRTFQSVWFDHETALVEARRVLKPGGLIVISIADAYKCEGDVLRRGQIVGSSIDLTAALAELCRITDTACALGFKALGFANLQTELVMYGLAEG